ncbi:MAG: hypothetical protein JWO76_1170 [Nocardioides sp.]|nr:hypothetical protein [Nocardioides sp.]
MTAYLDLERDRHEAGVEFWRRVTGFEVSPARGAHGEFASLLPPSGDDHLGLQRIEEGPSRIHLDVHVEDPAAAAVEAEAHGAGVAARPDPDYVVMRSPGGFTFCFVDHPGSSPAAPAEWEHGLRSAVDQVCLDIPASAYDRECEFWAWLTGWELRVSAEHDEFRRLIRPPDQPLQLLLQRLGEDSGPVRAHFDVASSDREAETSRHVGFGAEVQGVFGGWTVLTDPTGTAYCITDRTPETRVLDEVPAH